MPRTIIDLPSTFRFSATINIRITDINYGGHVGNDTVLSIIHEGRMQFLNSGGYTEMNCGGKGLIMSDAAIVFKKEIFYGDIITISVVAANFSKISFEIFYKIEKKSEDGNTVVVVAEAKTSMVYYDYQLKKVAALSSEVIDKLSAI